MGTVTGKGLPPGGNVLAGRRFLRRGDLVVASFAYQDNTCEFCREGLQTSCIHGGLLSEAPARSDIHERHQGHVEAAGVSRDGRFEDAGSTLDDQIDAAYRSRYRRYAASTPGPDHRPAGPVGHHQGAAGIAPTTLIRE